MMRRTVSTSPALARHSIAVARTAAATSGRAASRSASVTTGDEKQTNTQKNANATSVAWVSRAAAASAPSPPAGWQAPICVARNARTDGGAGGYRSRNAAPSVAGEQSPAGRSGSSARARDAPSRTALNITTTITTVPPRSPARMRRPPSNRHARRSRARQWPRFARQVAANVRFSTVRVRRQPPLPRPLCRSFTRQRPLRALNLTDEGRLAEVVPPRAAQGEAAVEGSRGRGARDRTCGPEGEAHRGRPRPAGARVGRSANVGAAGAGLGPARLRGRGRRDHRPAGGRAAVLRKSDRRDHRRHSRAGLRRRRGRAGLGGRAGTRRAGRVPWLGANAKRGRTGIGCRVRPRCFAEGLAGRSRAVVAADLYQELFT